MTIFLVSFFILLSAGFMFYYYRVVKDSRNPGLAFWGDDHGPSVRPFRFVNQEGDTITEQDVKGKILVVEYFFATCKSICPKMNENMAKVYQAFRTDDDVLILSHTVDPKNDSVAALKAYSQRFDADPKHWMFLTGDKAALYSQARLSYKITAVEKTTENIDKEQRIIDKIGIPDRILGPMRQEMTEEQQRHLDELPTSLPVYNSYKAGVCHFAGYFTSGIVTALFLYISDMHLVISGVMLLGVKFTAELYMNITVRKAVYPVRRTLLNISLTALMFVILYMLLKAIMLKG